MQQESMNNLSQKKLDIVQVRFEGFKRTSDEQQHRLSEILYGSDRKWLWREKSLKSWERRKGKEHGSCWIEAGNMKISVVKFWVDYKLKGIEFLCVDVMDEA